ncbi:MAG: CHASE domain-containing protein, partial [Alphaproteobacteria bacterium]
MQALEWIPRVTAPERGTFESKARKDGLAGFTFTEKDSRGGMVIAGMRKEYFPVYYVEPLKGNEAAVGFDLASNTTRLAALNAARDTGRLTATGRITLVQETQKSFGLLVFQPIFQGGVIPETIDERRTRLIGFGLGVLRIGDILSSGASGKRLSETVDTFVFDADAPPAQRRLFPAQSPFQSPDDIKRGRCINATTQVGGRTWNIVHCPIDQHEYLAHHTGSVTALIAGLLLFSLLAAYIRMLAKQRTSTLKFLDQLRISESRYGDIVDNTQALIQSIDSQTGKILFVNNSWLAALGYTAAEATGLQFSQLVHPDSLAHCQAVFEAANSGKGAQSVTTSFLSKDGKILDLDGHIVCRKNENGRMVTHCVFTDVSELIEARNAQARIADEMTTLIDTANAPIFGVDRRGHITDWNLKAAEITGYGSDEVMHCNLVNEFVADDHKASVKDVLDRALMGENLSNFEIPLFSKSGDRIDILCSSSARRDIHGAIIGVVGVGQDITERKRAFAQVVQASKLATLGEMATSVAHELNQPLNVIQMAAGNTIRKINKVGADTKYPLEKLERISAQTTRAAAIIDHMRMFGRKASEQPSAIDPREIVRGALDLMGEQLRLAEIEIETDLPDACPPVMGHKVQAEQVLLNLLTNARDAIQSQEGADRKRIGLSIVNGDAGSVKIIVEDTGGGIPSKVIDRIFEPFYTTKEMGKGTGLGLSVSYGIVRDMGGTITASNIGQGARFEITL